VEANCPPCADGALPETSPLPETTGRKTPFWKDYPLLVAERLARQVYWSSPRLRSWANRLRPRSRPMAQVADRREFKDYLRQVGVTEGALVMAHTSVSGLTLAEPSQQRFTHGAPALVARQLLDDLLELLGETGTLVMPTHAVYQRGDECLRRSDPGLPVRYDPAETPCGVGLANELFRRWKGVQRSLHPYNTLAAHGPLASELLRDNLNRSRPLAHGVHSGYYRFCQNRGVVVSIGVPLGRCLTLIHVAEDVRDEDWPIKGFFVERQYAVRIDGLDEVYVVRQHHPKYLESCLCARKMRRDLVGEGILHEGSIGSVRVDWACSNEVLDYLMSRNRKSAYPYYWPRLVRAER
jgi:aminoglycoside N3'-acetyltransferase